MQISEQHYAEFIDRLVHEGEPVLKIGPLARVPDDVPPEWADVLTAPDQREAVSRMWSPLADRLPRVCRALRERLRGVGLLCTDDVRASLVYFFKDGKELVPYRGGLPLADAELATAPLPAHFKDFYRIHDGWVSCFTEDYGPARSADWGALPVAWPKVVWKLPPGDLSSDTIVSVFRDGDDLAFAYSSLAHLPLRCRNDGTAELLLDFWLAVDREIGEFLENLDMASAATVVPFSGQEAAHRHERLLGGPIDQPQQAIRRYDHVLQHLREHQRNTIHLGGSFFHRQAFELLLDRAWIEGSSRGQEANLSDYCRRALREWCASIEAGGETDTDEVMAVFGLALALGDAASAHFVATMPASFWGDGSLEAHQLHVLFRLFLSDWPQAERGIGQMLGLTFDGESPPEEKAEIVTRLLESLFRKEHRAFAEWRQRVVEKLCSGPGEPNARLPWRIRLAAFDAVAYRLGIAEQMVTPFANATLT